MENNYEKCCFHLRKLAQAEFYAQDMKLYLDTHPDDEKALGIFVKASKEAKMLRHSFETEFYPLLCDNAGMNGRWDWLTGSFL